MINGFHNCLPRDDMIIFLVFFLTQNLFHAKQRVISLNADYIMVFRNPRDGSQFGHLAREVMPQNTKFLNWAYKEATENPHSYLLLYLKA